MHYEDAPRTPSLGLFALTFGPFGVAFFLIVLLSISEASVSYTRTIQFSWLALAYATVAFAVFGWRLGRAGLTGTWRMCWTFGVVAYLIHFWWGFFVMFKGDFGGVYAAQGNLVAASNFLVTLLWVVDVALSWVMRESPRWVPWFRLLVHVYVFVSIFVSAVIFHDGTVRTLGILSAIVVGAVLAARVWLWLFGGKAEATA